MKNRIRSICATLFISLFLSCNNSGEELEKLQKQNTFLSSLANLGNDFLNIFTSFGEMTGTVLGFNKDTKKSDVGKYFKNIEDNLTTTKTKLEKLVADMKDQGNPNAAATETAINKLVKETLDRIIEGAKTASEAIGPDAKDLIGNVAAVNTEKKGSAGDISKLDKLVDGIKNIVEVVLGNLGSPDAGDKSKASDSASNRNGTDGALKLFDGSSNGANTEAKEAANDASKAVGAITGADILKAMIVTSGDAIKLAKINGTTVSGINNYQDAIIAGAIALRAMASGGKFANGASGHDVTNAVKGTALSAVTKALDTLTIAIRRTIDEGLKEVKKAMNINANDMSVTTEFGTATK
nr:variable large family protein [Borrelia coriaceae]